MEESGAIVCVAVVSAVVLDVLLLHPVNAAENNTMETIRTKEDFLTINLVLDCNYT